MAVHMKIAKRCIVGRNNLVGTVYKISPSVEYFGLTKSGVVDWFNFRAESINFERDFPDKSYLCWS